MEDVPETVHLYDDGDDDGDDGDDNDEELF